MRRLAQIFVEGLAEEGEVFGWEASEALRLDGLCERFLASQPEAEVRNSMTVSMGAYLGELLVRNADGRWRFDDHLDAAVVDLPNGLVAFPMNKVHKRLDLGAAHNLADFYRYSITRQALPHQDVRTLD